MTKTIDMMIVDDEPVMRKGIITSIDWESYDIKVIGEANNGKEALAKAIALKPHIVITDIRMPIMDGLDFSKLLKRRLPDIRIIILSGYDDFVYAKEAVHLGLCEYLLKPVGAEELIKLVVNLKDEIIEEQRKRELEISTRTIFAENLPLLQSKFINSILKGEYRNQQSIIENANVLNINLTGKEYQVIVVDIDNYLLITEHLSMKDKDLLKSSVLNISQKVLDSNAIGLICFSEFDYLIGLINISSDLKMTITDICKEIQYYIRKHLKLSVTIGIGNTCKNLKEILKSYGEALTAMRRKVFRGKNNVIHINTINEAQNPILLVYPNEKEKDLINYMKAMDIEKLDGIIEKIFCSPTDLLLSYDSIKTVCIRLITMSMSTLEEMGINIEESLTENFKPYAQIEKYETIEDLKEWLKNLLKKFISVMQDNKNKKYKNIVKVAIRYVQDNYNKDISLDELTDVVYVTPNYFSRVFKEETGKKFIDWLNQFRIEKAKFLLGDVRYKIYEIADKIGYNDYKYFSYNFKKYAGCCPKEYRDRL